MGGSSSAASPSSIYAINRYNIGHRHGDSSSSRNNNGCYGHDRCNDGRRSSSSTTSTSNTAAATATATPPSINQGRYAMEYEQERHQVRSTEHAYLIQHHQQKEEVDNDNDSVDNIVSIN